MSGSPAPTAARLAQRAEHNACLPKGARLTTAPLNRMKPPRVNHASQPVNVPPSRPSHLLPMPPSGTVPAGLTGGRVRTTGPQRGALVRLTRLPQT